MALAPVFRRWMAFNLVGLGGIVVQLGVLAVLVHGLDVLYLAATAIAVEAAVLHNFAWHQRWTWRDRPAGSARAAAVRLGRFQFLNGAISLGGNVALMALLTGVMHLPVLAANLIAVLACSILNFAASETAVFRSSGAAAAVVLVVLCPAWVFAGQDPPTVAAWNAYQARNDARYASNSPGGDRFFVLDAAGSGSEWRQRALRGEVPLVSLDPPAVPDGKIHHWAGAVWIPHITVPALIERLVQQAGHESAEYEDVVASRLLSRNGDTLRVFMKLRRRSIVTVTYNTEHVVQYRRLSPSRASSRSVATHIAELEAPGEPGEHEKAPGEDRGFLWRLLAYWRYEEVEGGVLVECESVSLSRSVPFLIRPMASPIVDRIARESLERTLATLKRVHTPH